MKTSPLVALCCVLLVASAALAAEGRERIYFGTYGQAANDGVLVAELDLATGNVTEPRLAGRAVNASFVALHPDRRHLYTVAEVSSLGGRRTGGVEKRDRGDAVPSETCREIGAGVKAR